MVTGSIHPVDQWKWRLGAIYFEKIRLILTQKQT